MFEMLFKHNLFNACLVWILITRDILVQILRSSVSYFNFFLVPLKKSFELDPRGNGVSLSMQLCSFQMGIHFLKDPWIHGVAGRLRSFRCYMLCWRNNYMIQGIKLWEEFKFGSLKFWPTKIIDSEGFLVCPSSIPAILSLIVTKFEILLAYMHQNVWNHSLSVFIFPLRKLSF